MDGTLSESIRALIDRIQRLAVASRETAEETDKLAESATAELAKFRADAEYARRAETQGKN